MIVHAAQANGGYLILQAKDVLLNPQSWEVLKRLKTKEIRIETIGEHMPFVDDDIKTGAYPSGC